MRALIIFALAGCGAMVDVYRYQPQPLPAGTTPRAALQSALAQLESIEWADGHRAVPPGRLVVTSKDGGIEGTLILPGGRMASQLEVAYREFPSSVRSVTAYEGHWTVHLVDRYQHALDLRFPSSTAARQFLDAATALGASVVAAR